MIGRLVIVGVGDVIWRLVLPGLVELAAENELPDDVEVIGVGRGEHSTDWLRRRARDELRTEEHLDRAAIERIVQSLTFHRADATDADSMATLFTDAVPSLVHLALPPDVFPDAIAAVVEAEPAPGSRLVVEKPFGTDADSAATLNALARRHFEERDVIRVDHFLGERVAHNVLAARFANRVLAPVWNREHVERVDVVWDETLALEGRAGYYDGTGAARDMLQNHLLQLLCLVAMEPPESFGHHELADRKMDVLRAVRPWGDDPVTSSVRGRYGAGEIEGRAVGAYVDEDGVDPSRDTETYAEMVFEVRSRRWDGVPFRLRSGKALAGDRHEIALHLRPIDGADRRAGRPDESTEGAGDVIRLSVDPDEISIDMCLSVDDGPTQLDRSRLTHTFPESSLGPYALLLRTALAGGEGYSVRADEAVEQWRVVEPVLDAWQRDTVPLLEYRAGSEGPERADGVATMMTR